MAMVNDTVMGMNMENIRINKYNCLTNLEC